MKPADGQSAALLSLKNIYRVLFNPEFIAPAVAVIPKKKKSGTTVVKFWREMLLPEAAVHDTGARMWAYQGERNRYLSDLLNRTRTQGFYQEYFEALEQTLDTSALLQVTSRFYAFLNAADYSHPVLADKLCRFVDAFSRTDADVPESAAVYFNAMAAFLRRREDIGAREKAFACAYILSQLSLHALMSGHMNSEALKRLRVSRETQPEALWGRVCADSQETRVLTNRNSELCRQPLPRTAFIGREEALATLITLLRTGGKIAVTGMGGIGKTELLRQALTALSHEGVFSCVAYAQYDGRLAGSLYAAFADLHGATPESWLAEAKERLEAPQGRTLLLIDNMNAPDEADVAFLAGLGCDVCITTRAAAPAGFTGYALPSLPPEDALRLFRLSYGRPIEGAALADLTALLADKAAGHPLALRLLGSAAREKNLPAHLLRKEINRRGLDISFTQNASRLNVGKVLSTMFMQGGLSEKQARLLRLIALFPYQTYSLSELLCYAMDITRDKNELDALLYALAALGWLDANAGGCVMHPLIAETLCQAPPAFGDYPLFWQYMQDAIRSEDPYLCAPDVRRTLIAVHALLHTAKLPREILPLIVKLYDTCGFVNRSDVSSQLPPCYYDNMRRLSSPSAKEEGDYWMLCAHNALCDETHCTAQGVHAAHELMQLIETNSLDKKDLPPYLRSAFSVFNKTDDHEQIQRIYHYAESMYDRTNSESFILCASIRTDYALLYSGQYEKALTYAKEGIAYLTDKNALDSLYAVILLLPMVDIYALLGDFDQAKACYEAALQAIYKHYPLENCNQLPNLYFSMGHLYLQRGMYEKALELFFHSLDSVRRNHSPSPKIEALLYGDIGVSYFRLNQYEHAIENYLKSLHILQSYVVEQSIDLSRTYANLGRAYLSTGEKDKCLECYEKSADLARSSAGEKTLAYGEALYGMGQARAQYGQAREAVEALSTACPLLEASYGREHPRSQAARALLAAQEALLAQA